MLRDGLMIFGRSYKADIKLMMPYISRKHFSVSTGNLLSTVAST